MLEISRAISVPIIILVFIVSILGLYKPIIIIQIVVRPVVWLVKSNRILDDLYHHPDLFARNHQGQIKAIELGGLVGMMIVIASFCAIISK